MKRFFSSYIIITLFVLSLALNLLVNNAAFAQTTTASSTIITTFIPNPVIWNTLQELINALADFIAFVAIPLSVIMLIWSGLKFLLSQGNAEKVTTAKRTFIWTIVGVTAILGVYGILATVRRFFAEKSLF